MITHPRACSLVASAFCPFSQPLLFRAIVLHQSRQSFTLTVTDTLQSRDFELRDFPPTRVPSGTIRATSTLLSQSPHLAAYIRDLVIHISEYEPEDEVALETILRALPTVKRFVFFGNLISWKDLPPALTSAISHVFAQPTLDRVHLFNLWDVPISLILRLMTSLQYRYYRFTAYNSSPTLQTSWKLNLVLHGWNT
ncbi:hypothetical protein B0H19DRAFT_78361 [Mycena capillaripes]|nr:hypothetical protein B0H19DRAFT_78361 [Mycena capillaripes]